MEIKPLEVGDKAEVIKNNSSHEFPIGTIVVIKHVYLPPKHTNLHYKCKANTAIWWLGHEELKKIEKDSK